jgi:hypothetical protein
MASIRSGSADTPVLSIRCCVQGKAGLGKFAYNCIQMAQMFFKGPGLYQNVVYVERNVSLGSTT